MLRCSYVFPDGRPCGSPAPQGRSLCRHHTSQALEERASRVPAPPPDLDENSPRFEYTVYWRGYHAVIRDSDESEFDDILANLFSGLEQGVLTDRAAGHLLRTLVQRRRQLHEQRMVEHFMRLAQQHRANPHPAGTSALGPSHQHSLQVEGLLGLSARKAIR